MDVPAEVTQEEDHIGFLHLPSVVLALFFLARRIQSFLSLVDCEVDFKCSWPFFHVSFLGKYQNV